MKEELLQLVKEESLEDLYPLFEILAKRVFAYRRENRGFIPGVIFPFCLAIGGDYLCAEVVLEVQNGEGSIEFGLKKRGEAGEQGWEGQYQIPGVSIRTTDSPGDIMDRLAREYFGDDGRASDFSELEFVGIETHDESERMATCWTMVWKMRMDRKEVSKLSGEWKIFPDTRDQSIVDHHQQTLAWVQEGEENRRLFVDLR